MKFTARYLEPRLEAGIANMLFADPETDPDAPAVVMFSRTLEFEDTAYYFEINDQSNSSYGGLEEVRLTRDSITVRVAPEVAAQFGDADLAEVEARFDADPEVFAEIEKVMRVVFERDPILVVV